MKTNHFFMKFSDQLMINISPSEAAELGGEKKDKVQPVRIKLPLKFRKPTTSTDAVEDLREVLHNKPQKAPRAKRAPAKKKADIETEEKSVRSIVIRAIKGIQVLITARVLQINKPDEILMGDTNPKCVFITKEEPGFHIADDFYHKIVAEAKDRLQNQEPLRMFQTDGWEYRLDDAKITYNYRDIDNKEAQQQIRLPLTFLQRSIIPDPIVTQTRDNDYSAEFNITFQCTVATTLNTAMICRVPFSTNKQACENAINRLKVIAHHSSALMPHVTICKLNELLHMFRMESMNIFMKTWPTSAPLPPRDETERKFHQILCGGPPQPRTPSTGPVAANGPSFATPGPSTRPATAVRPIQERPRREGNEPDHRYRSLMTSHHKKNDDYRFKPY